MSFNDNVNLDSSRVSTSRGRGRGVALGGGGLVVVIGLFIVSQVTGIDFLSMFTGSSTGSNSATQVQESQGKDLSHCKTGADANKYDECRMVATAQSLGAMWSTALSEQANVQYKKPDFNIFEDAVQTKCGAATSQVGPFYCPADNTVYLDLSFFNELSKFGAQDGPLAQEYIVAHEWGHHIQNLTGQFQSHNSQQTGAQSESVRMELQADCYAGIWVNRAAKTPDPKSGQPFLKTPTDEQIRNALSVASSIGDDHIQEQSGGKINQDSWTHGSSAQRTQWFKTGIQTGSIAHCDTFEGSL